MERESEKPAEVSSRAAGAVGVPGKLSRRSLLRAGASGAPVLLTLASGPVSASTVGCTVASSFVSVNTFKSRNPAPTVVCGSRNCEYWQGQAGYPNHWPGSNCANGALNVTCSSLMGAPSGCSYNTTKVCDVLGQAIVTSGQLGVLQHLSSLCLDATTGNIATPNGINQSYLQGMWQQYVQSGTYKAPGSGLVWNESQIISWARSMLGYTIP